MKIEFHEGEPQSSRLCVPTLCAPILACSDNTQHTWQVIHITKAWNVKIDFNFLVASEIILVKR